MSDFASMADLARSAVEGVHGDALRVFPVDGVDVNAAGSSSQTRAAFDTTGCFFQDSQDPLGSRGAMSVPNSRPMLNRSTLLTCSIRLPDGTAPIKSGDRCRVDAGKYTGRWFVIGDIDPDGLGGAIVSLSHSKPLADAS
jgi:hypothetical protein